MPLEKRITRTPRLQHFPVPDAQFDRGDAVVGVDARRIREPDALPLRVKKRKAFGHSREHISLEVTEEGSGITLQAKAWRQADQIPESIQGQRIRLAYTPGINAYNGIASVELRVRDWEVL